MHDRVADTHMPQLKGNLTAVYHVTSHHVTPHHITSRRITSGLQDAEMDEASSGSDEGSTGSDEDVDEGEDESDESSEGGDDDASGSSMSEGSGSGSGSASGSEEASSSEDGEEGEEEEEEEGHRGKKKAQQAPAASKKAAAAMAVGVGSFSDPAELQGLSHYLEHMLFMGSERFPDENDYDAFLSKHAGSSNAYTELVSKACRQKLLRCNPCIAIYRNHPTTAN